MEKLSLGRHSNAATHLLPMRDDFDPALTFRSIFLAIGLAAFQAAMYQIYMVSFHILCLAHFKQT